MDSCFVDVLRNNYRNTPCNIQIPATNMFIAIQKIMQETFWQNMYYRIGKPHNPLQETLEKVWYLTQAVSYLAYLGPEIWEFLLEKRKNVNIKLFFLKKKEKKKKVKPERCPGWLCKKHLPSSWIQTMSQKISFSCIPLTWC